jgi:hypothetical protein
MRRRFRGSIEFRASPDTPEMNHLPRPFQDPSDPLPRPGLAPPIPPPGSEGGLGRPPSADLKGRTRATRPAPTSCFWT